MSGWNQDLFLLLNAPGHQAARLMQAVASSPVAVAPLLLIGL